MFFFLSFYTSPVSLIAGSFVVQAILFSLLLTHESCLGARQEYGKEFILATYLLHHYMEFADVNNCGFYFILLPACVELLNECKCLFLFLFFCVVDAVVITVNIRVSVL